MKNQIQFVSLQQQSCCTCNDFESSEEDKEDESSEEEEPSEEEEEEESSEEEEEGKEEVSCAGLICDCSLNRRAIILTLEKQSFDLIFEFHFPISYMFSVL